MTHAADRNRAYYDARTAGKDDYWRKMAAPRARVRTLLRLIGEVPQARHLIDLGCGGGQLLSDVAAAYPHLQLTGVDISEVQLAENRRSMPGHRFHRMNLDDADAVPAELEGLFDVVTSSEVVEHLEHPAHLVASARRLLRPGGVLLLSTQSGVVRETERRVGHVRHWPATDMTTLLERNGFRVRRVWNEGWPFHDASKWWANRDPDGSIDQFAGEAYGWKQNTVCWALRAAFRLNSRRRGAQLYAVAEAV